MSDVASGSSLSSWPAFSARPFRSDGGSSLMGLMILTLVTCLTGGMIGLFAGFISQWFFLVVLFPLGMGIVIGAVGAFGVKAGKVRMPIVCGTAGFLGGCVAVVAMHGFEYYQFEQQLRGVPPEIRQLARHFDQLQPLLKQQDPQVQEVLNELAKDADSRRGLAVNGLFSFVDLKAHQGVEISRARGGGKGMNLGYVGSYCYWGFELLLIAGVAFAIMKGTAEEPFCSNCDTWKTADGLGAFEGSSPHIQDALTNGDLTGISAHVGPGDRLTASVFTCPNCGAESPIDVRIDKVTINEKGESSVSPLCTITYPGEALEPVRQVFAAAAQTTNAVAEPTVEPVKEATDAESPNQSDEAEHRDSP